MLSQIHGHHWVVDMSAPLQITSTDTFHLEQLDNGKFRVRIKKLSGESRGLIQHREIGHNLNHHTEYTIVDHLIHFDDTTCMFDTRHGAMQAALEIRKLKPPEVVSTTEIEFAQVDGNVVLSFTDHGDHSVVAQ